MNELSTGLRAWSHFLGAHALALKAIEAALKSAGLPPLAWYDLLWELERAGGRLRIGDLADRLVIERYNMTRLLDRLEKEGLVARMADPDDRRGSIVSLAEAGRAMRERIWPVYQKAVHTAFSDALGEDDQAAIIAACKKIIARHRP